MNALVGLMVQVMLPLSLLVAAGGWWAARMGEGRDADVLRAQLNRLVLYVFYPAILFAVAASTPISLDLLTVPFLVGLGTLANGALLYLLLWKTRLGAKLHDTTRAAIMLGGMFGNTFNVGAPVLEFFFGNGAMRYAIFNDMFMTMPFVWTLGVWIATRLGSHAEGERPDVLRTVLMMPPIWAFVLGLGAQYTGLAYPPLVQAARFIGQAAIPVIIFVLGMTIPWRRLVPRTEILVASGVKLLVAPLLIWGLVLLVSDTPNEAQRASLVECATPTFMTSLLLAERFKIDAAASALLIGWSTLLFWLSLPLLMGLGLFG
ncbi:AEC family transporter [Methyloversatilis discipulorum]|jgi:malate permease and related proteins|uniref:AEC family transporter n=1 Tax=Methyloversatilis discipulorum TaxID=1119528 RepID=UPI003F3867D5